MNVIRGIAKKIDITALILILSVSAVIAYGYFNRVDRPNFELRFELHNQIITGTAPSPYRYRILVPLTAEILTKVLSVILPVNASFLLAYAIYDLLAIFFLLVALFFWLKTWFRRDQGTCWLLVCRRHNANCASRSLFSTLVLVGGGDFLGSIACHS